MRDDFCVFILTHGRPDNVVTLKALKKGGYTGRVYLVVDDEDTSAGEYLRRYGASNVLLFSKERVANEYDQGDNFRDRRTVFYARNACWDLAEVVGCRYFVELDDDYGDFLYRLVGRKNPGAPPKYHGWLIRSLDAVFEAMLAFAQVTKAKAVAMSQGGDHIGGAAGATEIRVTRKAMNLFICDTANPFEFVGRVNEDVSTYVSRGSRGDLFFTYWALQLNQAATQSVGGGMTATYLDDGTYVKSFYSVMYAPSCVRVEYVTAMRRLHHRIQWEQAVPKIVSDVYRKTGGE